MTPLNRRDFVKVGAGGISGLFASAGLAQSARSDEPAVPPVAPVAYEHAFFIEPGLISRLNKETSELSDASLWAVPGGFEPQVSSLLVPASFDLDQLEQWARERTSDCCSVTLPGIDGSSSPLDVVMQVPITGAPVVTDITAEAFTSLTDRAGLDLSVEFLHRTEADLVASDQLSMSSGLPVVQAPSLQLPGIQPLVFTFVELYGWRLQFRGPEIHPLGGCVSAPVNHLHLEVFRAIGGGRYQYVSNFHLGTYRSGGTRCIVLYNNYRPSVCWRVCGPNPNDLAAMLKWVLLVSAAIVAAAILAWVALLIAEAAAGLIFVPLIALA